SFVDILNDTIILQFLISFLCMVHSLELPDSQVVQLIVSFVWHLMNCSVRWLIIQESKKVFAKQITIVHQHILRNIWRMIYFWLMSTTREISKILHTTLIGYPWRVFV